MFRFERLEVWRKSMEFASAVYALTSEFPTREQFGLASQLRRAAVSIGANIAEGSSRTSDRDFSRFIEIAYGSLCEVISHLCIARSQELISEEQQHQAYAAGEELGKALTAFRNSLGKWKTVAEPDQ